MEKLPFFLIFFSLAIAAGNEADEWLGNCRQATEKTTRLHFYLHDTTSGKNPTAVQVAQAGSTNNSTTFFGLTYIMDDPIKEGPELTSKLVGRGQGLYASAGLDELSLLMAWTVVFKSVAYNGSSLIILGRNPTTHRRREMSIVGGTGVFRLARGEMTFKTYFFNSSAGIGVLEVDAVGYPLLSVKFMHGSFLVLVITTGLLVACLITFVAMMFLAFPMMHVIDWLFL